MTATFLSAYVPLTKKVTREPSGVISKSPYPNVLSVTSHVEPVSDLATLHAAIQTHAALGHCLLKGNVSRPLVNESRAGSTDASAPTHWLCLDVDGIPDTYTPVASDVNPHPKTLKITPDTFLQHIGLTDVSYILQWSASQGLPGTSGMLRMHLFVWLTRPVPAPLIKQWLIHLNHTVPLLRDAQALTKTGNALTWGLDITTCQNDKLIYIAPPTFQGMKSPMGRTPRMQLVTHALPAFTFPSTVTPINVNRDITVKRIAELRNLAGLPARKFVTKMSGTVEVLAKPDICTVTGMRTERGFVYLNLNDGDSWGYYHPEDRADYIYNFKGEPNYLTKELLPAYWATLTAQASRTTAAGLTYLAFLDRRSGAYYRGTYEASTDTLDLNIAKNETQIRHFAEQNGVPLGSYIAEWDMTFDPNDSVRVDPVNKTINTFQLTEYMRTPAKHVSRCPPTIFKIIHHVLGSDTACTAHFINWLSFIVQRRNRTLTAWVLHGTEGCLTGDTRINFRRGKRNAGRDLTIKEAYEKWTGQFQQGTGLGKAWTPGLTTYAKAVKDNMTVGYHEVYDIVQAGIKPVYTLTTDRGRRITATAQHPFMRPDSSFTTLGALTPGDEVVIEGQHNDHVAKPQGRKRRHTTYSIPHHPYAWQHLINGKNYKRSHTARLVVEADMNGLTLDAFVHTLRNDQLTAECLVYLDPSVIVHHVDEDPSNDALDNLEIVTKENHDAHHAQHVGLGTINTAIETVASITFVGEQMTYDMTMKAPYQNYIANGFAVHNTGKGILMNRILRPLLGRNQTTMRRMEEFNEPYNAFMKQCFLVFVDEVEAKAFTNEKGVMAKIRTFIAEEFVSIRQMYSNAMEWPNYTNWIFASNRPEPVVIPTEDRRFNVGKYQPAKLGMTDAELANIPQELQTFHDFLLSHTLDLKAVATVLDNADRTAMIAVSQSSVDTVAAALLRGDMEFLLDQLPSTMAYSGNAAKTTKIEDYKHALKAVMLRTHSVTGRCNISRDELHAIFDYVVGGMPESPNKFTSLLKHHRIQTTKVWCDNKAVYGISTEFQDVSNFGNYVNTYFPAPASARVTAPTKKPAPKVKVTT